MALKVTTTVINLKSIHDWTDSGGDEDDFRRLIHHVKTNTPVEVLSLETDGYYNVKCHDGHVVVGLSHWHLDGIDYDGLHGFV